MAVNIGKLNNLIEELKEDLGDSLLSTDVWEHSDGQPIAGYNMQPKAAALFNEVSKKVEKALKQANFPGFGNYFIAQFENKLLGVLVHVGNYRQGFTVDLSKTTMGVVINVTLPKIIHGLKDATS